MTQRELLIKALSEFYYQDVPPCNGCPHYEVEGDPECEKCIIEHEVDFLLSVGVTITKHDKEEDDED